ncbi:MAG TPA: hypothetical protein VJU59_28855 [Paraburkholderia sp.]|nr:hypothetical protein [Paraburkholderia sp.]HKR43642.1 hypothetical protein [Paraburkholderia sp.]
MKRQIVIATVAASLVAAACLCAVSVYAGPLPSLASVGRAN